MDIRGRWLDTILYEIPLLALTSEAYFKFCDTDWTHADQTEKAYQKGLKLMENGCIFSEFGTRRRRDHHTQDLVLSGLKRAHEEAKQRGRTGKLSGTSNVHFAMKYGIPPVGTVAHEWFMGIASITNDYEHANETALRYWVGCFGEGVLGIALTDTFGTPVFLRAFKRTMPTPEEAEVDAIATRIPQATGAPVSPADSPTKEDRAPDYMRSKGRSYARIFQGVRQDSGDPLAFVKMMRDFYESEGIQEKKTVVFSDSLNIERCLEYRQAAEEAGLNPTFGVGTFLTSKSPSFLTISSSLPAILKQIRLNRRLHPFLHGHQIRPPQHRHQALLRQRHARHQNQRQHREEHRQRRGRPSGEGDAWVYREGLGSGGREDALGKC